MNKRKTKGKLLKNCFFLTIFLIVTIQLFLIIRHVNAEELKGIFFAFPTWQLVLFIIVGVLAVLPMIGYDLVLYQRSESKEKKLEVLESSLLMNTTNNLFGFGRVFSFALRSQFYGGVREQRRIFRDISLVSIYAMSGLSVLSIFTLVLIAIGQLQTAHYWLFIVGGALYFPIAASVFRWKKKEGFPLKEQVELIFFSLFEWLAMLFTFVLIGVMLETGFSIQVMMSLFLAAMIIGMLSMIPGGIGAFDVVAIIGLHTLGLDLSIAVAWVILFRLVYYVFPFLVCLLFLASHLGTTFNKNYQGVPLKLVRETLHHLVTFLLYVSGILLVLSTTLPGLFYQWTWLSHISPWGEHFVLRLPSLIFGLLFIVVGRGVAKRVKRVYIPTLMIEAVVLIYTFILMGFGGAVVFLVLLIFLTIFTRHELFREQLVMSSEFLVKDGVIYFLLLILYIGIGVYNSPPLKHLHHAQNTLFVIPSEYFWLLGFLMILFVNLLVFAFLRYLQGEKRAIGEAINEERIRMILQAYGGNATSHLIFLKDKDMFVYTNANGVDTAFLQFQLYFDKAIVMGSPSGNREDFEPLLQDFIQACDKFGYAPVFYEVEENIAMYLHEFGYSFFKMGEEGHVNLKEFTLSGKKQKNNRAMANKLHREGYYLEVVNAPFDDSLLERLKEISDEWLGDRKEKGFSLGFFTKEYVSQAPIAVVKDSKGGILAFATIMPSYTKELVAVDLMRYSKKSPSGVMDFLFIELFQYYQEQGMAYFDLGMAPLSNVGVNRHSFLQERVANLVYQFGSRFYSFQGLRGYKEKYASQWMPKYTLYPKDSSVIFVVYSLIKVDNRAVDLE